MDGPRVGEPLAIRCVSLGRHARVSSRLSPSHLGVLALVRALHCTATMRISALSVLPGLLAGALAAPARADPSELVKPPAATGSSPAAPAARRDRPARPQRGVALVVPVRDHGLGASLATGDLRLTGSTPPEHRDHRDHRDGPMPAERQAPFLAAGEIAAEVRPFAPEIERCYLERLGDTHRAGHLDLTLVIGRDGAVVSVSAAAPGLPGRAAHQVESCIRGTVETLHFPERRNDTTAVVPYYFQRTRAPGAGPQLSCWNPRGC